MKRQPSTSSLRRGLLVLAAALGVWLHVDAWNGRREQLHGVQYETQVVEASLTSGMSRDELAQLRRDVEEAAQAVGSDVTALIDTVTLELAALDVSQRSLAVERTERAGPLSRTSVLVNFRGGLAETCAFLQQIDSRGASLRLRRLRVTPDRVSDGELEVACVLDAFARTDGGEP